MRRELSVFCVDGLTPPEARAHVAQHGRTDVQLYMWAEVRTGVVHHVQLAIEYDSTPPRHANIVGWPDDRDQELSKRQELAESAVVYPGEPDRVAVA